MEFVSGIFNNFCFAEDDEGDGAAEVAHIERFVVSVEQKDFVFGHRNHFSRCWFAGLAQKSPRSCH